LSLEESHIVLEKTNNSKIPGTGPLNVGLSKCGCGGSVLNLNCYNYLTKWPEHQE